MNSPISKYCESCNKKTSHESFLIKKELLKKGRFNSGFWLFLGTVTLGVSYMIIAFFIKNDEIHYFYKEICQECGYKTNIDMIDDQYHIRW